MAMSKDLLCQKILEGLLKLEKVINTPLASKALELGENANTTRQQDMLVRLRKSLAQYSERSGNLVYVALIGHYSSGKSSTINSLLDLWGSTDMRVVELQPTDRVITLITRKENSQSLLGVASHGSVLITVQTIENDLLNNVVLADTPGAGDTQLIQDMARDFLPICDLVLYFFSATNLFDTTDIPILSELHQRLPFIPLKFVVTRADELRDDPEHPLSSCNFDQGRAVALIANVISRINVITDKYTYEDFFLIDNKYQYEIASLKSYIRNRSDPGNYSTRLEMHSHKVGFYQSSSEGLREFFSSFLDEKLGKLKSIVSTADGNIKRYNDAVSIANNNLTRSWLEIHNTIQELKPKNSAPVKSLPEPPISVFAFKPASEAVSAMREDIIRQIPGIVKQVEQHARQTCFIKLQSRLSTVRRTLAKRDLDTLKDHDHGLGPIPISDWSFGPVDVLQVSYLSHKSDEMREKVRRLVNDLTSNTRWAYEELLRAVKQRHVIGRCEEIVYAAQSSLAQDLDRYFQVVEIYRAGVFALNTKDSISKLGVGGQLDKLETEFTNEDKEAIKIKAKGNLFPSFDDMVAVTNTQLAAIADQARSYLDAMGNSRLASPPTVTHQISESASQHLLDLTEVVRNEMQQEVNELVTSLQDKLGLTIGATLDAYEKESNAARKARNKRYLSLIFGAGGILFAAYYIYGWLVKPPGESKLEMILWGLLFELVGNLGGFLWARFRDGYPVRIKTIKERLTKSLNEQIRTVIDSTVEKYSFSALRRENLGAKLEKIYSLVTSPVVDDWQVFAEERYQQTRGLIKKYNEVLHSYLAIVDRFVQNSSQYFEDTQQNLIALIDIAREIKEHAIEPSFTLLADTKGQLQELRDEISATKFS